MKPYYIAAMALTLSVSGSPLFAQDAAPVAEAAPAAAEVAPATTAAPQQEAVNPIANVMQQHRQQRQQLHQEYMQKLRETKDPEARYQMMQEHQRQMQQHMVEMREAVMQERMAAFQAMQQERMGDTPPEGAEMPAMPFGPYGVPPQQPMPGGFGYPGQMPGQMGYGPRGYGNPQMYNNNPMREEMCNERRKQNQGHRQIMEERLERIEGVLQQLLDAQKPAAAVQ